MARMINKATAARSTTMNTGNNRWNSHITKPKPSGKISGNAIGMI
jgi:hypothetical protein